MSKIKGKWIANQLAVDSIENEFHAAKPRSEAMQQNHKAKPRSEAMQRSHAVKPCSEATKQNHEAINRMHIAFRSRQPLIVNGQRNTQKAPAFENTDRWQLQQARGSPNASPLPVTKRAADRNA